eukprot:g2480.t1
MTALSTGAGTTVTDFVADLKQGFVDAGEVSPSSMGASFAPPTRTKRVQTPAPTPAVALPSEQKWDEKRSQELLIVALVTVCAVSLLVVACAFLSKRCQRQKDVWAATDKKKAKKNKKKPKGKAKVYAQSPAASALNDSSASDMGTMQSSLSWGKSQIPHHASTRSTGSASANPMSPDHPSAFAGSMLASAAAAGASTEVALGRWLRGLDPNLAHFAAPLRARGLRKLKDLIAAEELSLELNEVGMARAQQLTVLMEVQRLKAAQESVHRQLLLEVEKARDRRGRGLAPTSPGASPGAGWPPLANSM